MSTLFAINWRLWPPCGVPLASLRPPVALCGLPVAPGSQNLLILGSHFELIFRYFRDPSRAAMILATTHQMQVKTLFWRVRPLSWDPFLDPFWHLKRDSSSSSNWTPFFGVGRGGRGGAEPPLSKSKISRMNPTSIAERAFRNLTISGLLNICLFILFNLLN